MWQRHLVYLLLCLCVAAVAKPPQPMPADFVYLRDVAPTILQDLRYAEYHNFIGKPLNGYFANECIVTNRAALALASVQHTLQQSRLSLKVYDCYRPQMAVDEMLAWGKKNNDNAMQAEFYPRLNKTQVLTDYITIPSAHSRGSTVDVTLVNVPTYQQAEYHRGQPLSACYNPYLQRFADNSIDMGSGYDCLDKTAKPTTQHSSAVARAHRQLLREVMMAQGFVPSAKAWWHFSLQPEPYPDTTFNFPIVSKN